MACFCLVPQSMVQCWKAVAEVASTVAVIESWDQWYNSLFKRFWFSSDHSGHAGMVRMVFHSREQQDIALMTCWRCVGSHKLQHQPVICRALNSSFTVSSLHYSFLQYFTLHIASILTTRTITVIKTSTEGIVKS